MSKYIRTKEDIICEEIAHKRYKVANMGAWKEIKIDFEYGTNPDRILKQADSLEELCDEFVYCFRDEEPIFLYEKEIEKNKNIRFIKICICWYLD